MSLEDYGARSWASLRPLERDDHGEVCCPVSGQPIEHSRGEIAVPVARLADDELVDALQAAGVEHVRSRGYESHTHEILVPETVGGPSAAGYSSRIVGVRADLGEGHADWIPVHADDLEAADDGLALAADSSAAADGSGGASASESANGHGAPANAVSDGVGTTAPDQAADLGLASEYPDGHPRWTYVGHVQYDEVDVYVGRSGQEGEHNLITVDEPGERGWLGNPFLIESAGGDYSREESVAAFTHAFLELLEEDPDLRAAVHDLRGQVLGCYCHRLEEIGDDAALCHGDVIARVADRVIKRRDGGDGQNGGDDRV